MLEVSSLMNNKLRTLMSFPGIKNMIPVSVAETLGQLDQELRLVDIPNEVLLQIILDLAKGQPAISQDGGSKPKGHDGGAVIMKCKVCDSINYFEEQGV